MFRERRLWPLWILAGLIVLSTQFVASQFPDYLPSHIAQLAALAAGVLYFRKFDLWDRYPAQAQRLSLLLAYAIPFGNIFLVKVFRKAVLGSNLALELLRPEILLLLAAVALTAHKRFGLPRILLAAAWLTAASVLVSAAASSDPVYAAAAGFFEGIIPFLVIILYARNASDRAFLWHALTLFALAFTIVAAAQSASIMLHKCCAYTSAGFLGGKMDLPLMKAAGGNGYGNTTNFVSLAVLIVPFLAASIFGCTVLRSARTVAVGVLVYATLLVYSRAGLLVLLIGMAAVCLSFRRAAPAWGRAALATIIIAVVAVHIPTGGLSYYKSGVESFIGVEKNHAPPRGAAANARRESTRPQAEAAAPGEPPLPDAEIVLKSEKPDLSGKDRAAAMRQGLAIARANWKTGIGYGMYVRSESEFTSPHSMPILRIAEGGIIGLAGFVLLWLAIPVLLYRRRRELDGLDIACLVSLSCFFVYGSLLGAAFSLLGIVPWGFGVGLMIACLLPGAPSEGMT